MFPSPVLNWLLAGLALLAPLAQAQYSLTHPRGRVELEARLRTAWHHRWLFPGDEDHNKDRFYVESARLKFSGQQYRFRLAWELQLELRGHNGLERETGQEQDHQGLEARDLHLSWLPSDQLTLRMGQQKVPYGRKQLIPEHAQSIVRRPEVVNDFLPGRDRGLLLRARTPVRDWTGWLGVFTGNGENHKYDDPAGRPLYAARLEWAPLGELGGEEGDFSHSKRLRVLAGVNLAQSRDKAPALEDPRDYLRTIDGEKLLYGGDFSAKWRGWQGTLEFDHARLRPDSGDGYRAGGYMAQLQYAWRLPWNALAGWVLEPVVAYDEFNPNHRRADDTMRGLTTGINLLPDGHDFKIMLDWLHRFKLREGDANPWKEDELRLLVQLRVL
ncbi:MAG: porin [Candidatus Delongbacteria bacterium]